MLQTICIGHIGADAETKNDNGREFTTFRIAHTERWTDANGTTHDETTWVDCVMNGKPTVVEYLKRGAQVFVMGTCRLRVYSSKKDRCMKAGITIAVRTVELIGSKADPVPAILYREDGQAVDVQKHFYCPELVRGDKEAESVVLTSRSQGRFVVNRNGWVTPEPSACPAASEDMAAEKNVDDIWNNM